MISFKDNDDLLDMAYSLLFAGYYFVIRLKFEKFEFSNEFLS